MLPSRPGAMILPEVTLPLNTLRVYTAYSLLRTLLNFCCENPGVLDTTSALVQLPPVDDARSPYQVPPPPPVWPVPQLPLRGLSLTGDLRSEQEEYAENVYVYHLINAATALANASRQDVGEGHAAIKDISVCFGVDRQRLNVVCTEAPGVVVYTDPAMIDEADMDSLLDGNYGAQTLTQTERIHYGDLKDRYRQRRDRTRQLVAQLSTLNTRQNLNPTEVRLLERMLSKEDIRKFSKFETLATTICDQQDAIEGLRRHYDEQVASSSAQLAHLTRSHEAKMAQELGQAKVQIDVATVGFDAARDTEINCGNQSRHVQDAPPDGTCSSSMHPLRREELIPDSMRKTTLANLEMKTLKAFRKFFAHHKNAHAKISDWVSYIPVKLHTQVRARIRRVVNPKTEKKRFTPAQVDNWQDMDVLTVLDVLIEPNAAEIVDGNSLVVVLENIELVPSEFFISRYNETLEHQLSTIYRQFMLVYEDCRHEESTPQVRAIERAFKKSSEGQRLNKLNVDGFLPRSIGEYMNAAEDLAAEAEAALRKARNYTDAAGGKTSASGAGAKQRQQASSYQKKCHGCGMFDHAHQD